MATEVLVGIPRNAETATIKEAAAVRMTGTSASNGTVFLRVDPTGLAERGTTFLHVRSNDPWIHVDGADKLQFMINQRQVTTNILSLSRLK